MGWMGLVMGMSGRLEGLNELVKCGDCRVLGKVEVSGDEVGG